MNLLLATKQVATTLKMLLCLPLWKESRRTPVDHSHLTLLFEISQIVAGNPEVRETIRPILKLLCTTIQAQRGIINIINRQTSELPIEESFGLTPEEQSQSHSKLGEGLIGMVGETGKPVVVSNISQKRTFRGSRSCANVNPTARATFPSFLLRTPFFRTGKFMALSASSATVRRSEPTDDDLRLFTADRFS